MEIIKLTRADRVVRELDETARKAHRQQVDGWIRALKAAEAKAVADKLPLRLYQANYRVEDEKSATKGSYDLRRGAVVELLKSLSPKERHPSTSTWIFQLHIADAPVIANLLAPPLDSAIDFLSVAELTANRTTIGSAGLKS